MITIKEKLLKLFYKFNNYFIAIGFFVLAIGIFAQNLLLIGIGILITAISFIHKEARK